MELLDKIKDNFNRTSFEIDKSMPIIELSKRFRDTFECSLRKSNRDTEISIII
jgi:hypothetical protein